jgi:small-conductance mechanosensitive channel
MAPQFVKGSLLLESLWALGIVVVCILGAWLVLLGIRFAEGRLRRGRHRVSPKLLESIIRPLFLLIVVEGIILALSSISYLAKWLIYFAEAGVAVLIVAATYAVARGLGALLEWYMGTRAVRRRVAVDQGLVRLLQRVTTIVVYAIGLLIVLDYLGISITPIVAGLGVGGLAVALALQPLLGNFFAGTQIVSDRVVQVGDYVEMDNGTRGYIADVGWRSTRIRTVYNNLVIIPNSRLADSIVTNFQNPSTAVGITVNAGVSYSSDLVQVERVTMEVAREVIEELDVAVKDFEPIFRFEQFGDSNIDFWVWVQAVDRLGSFLLKSEIIKRLHARFKKEGITINYPARYVSFDRFSGTEYLRYPEMPPRLRSGESEKGGGEGEG